MDRVSAWTDLCVGRRVSLGIPLTSTGLGLECIVSLAFFGQVDKGATVVGCEYLGQYEPKGGACQGQCGLFEPGECVRLKATKFARRCLVDAWRK